MRQVKVDCEYCASPSLKTRSSEAHSDWEMHPSWITGMEALSSYSDWVSSVVLPIAFQWIDEHKSEVYATIKEDVRDDVGTVLAAAFKLIKELPAHKKGMAKTAAYEAAVATGKTARINPVWTGVVKKIRTSTEAAFAEQSSHLGDPPQKG